MAEEKRAEKRLEASARSGKYIKQDFIDLHERVENGEPFALLGAMVPVELFRAMDIPYVFQPWWQAVVNAKRYGNKMWDCLKEGGYRDDICSYCSMAFACSFDPSPKEGPWGGLPKPTIIVGGSNQDDSASWKLDELMARQFGADICHIQLLKQQNLPDCWWELEEDNWEELITTERLDHYEHEVRKLADFLERVTGRNLDINKLNHILNNVNEQERYNKMARDIIARTKPAPATINDTINAVQQAQWLRGTEWAKEHARLFYEEIKDRAEKGIGAIKDEKVRLMWLGAGLWVDTYFYQYFEEKYGADFIWSIYLGVGSDCYPRHHVEENPFRNMAARIAIIEDMLHHAKFCSQWYVHEALKSQIDGVVYLLPTNCPNNNRDFSYSVIKEMNRVGIPVMVLQADPADAKSWNQDVMAAKLEKMIVEEILPKKQ